MFPRLSNKPRRRQGGEGGQDGMVQPFWQVSGPRSRPHMQPTTNSLTESKTLNTELELAPQTEEETATGTPQETAAESSADAHSQPQAPAELASSGEATYATPGVYVTEEAPAAPPAAAPAAAMHSDPYSDAAPPTAPPAAAMHSDPYSDVAAPVVAEDDAAGEDFDFAAALENFDRETR